MQNLKSKLGTAVGASIGIPVTFTLEVLGAAGAIWGVSETVGLRSEENAVYWRVAAIVTGALSFLAYCGRHFIPSPNQAQQHRNGFFSAVNYAITKPYQALYVEFLCNNDNNETRTLLK